MLKRVVCLLQVCLLGLILIGCGIGQKEPVIEGGKQLGSVAITDANCLVLTQGQFNIQDQGVVSSANVGSDRLFMVTDDGLFEEVEYLDENGNELSEDHYMAYPLAMYNVNKDYIISVLMEEKHEKIIYPDGSLEENWEQLPSTYLIRISDGSVWSIGEPGYQLYLGESHRLQKKIVQSDQLGNIYYIERGILYMIDTTNPERLTIKPLTHEFEIVREFVVDNDGNIVFYSSIKGSDIITAITKEGKFIELVEQKYIDKVFWLHDGKIYIAEDITDDYSNPYYYHTQVYQVEISSDTVDLVPYGEPIQINNNPVYVRKGLVMYSIGERLVCLVESYGEVTHLVELNNPENQPRFIRDLDGNFYDGDSSENIFYLFLASSSDEIYKFSPEDDYYQNIITLGDSLNINSLSVNFNNEITIHGFRTSDRSSVLATIDNNETYYLVQEDLPIEVELVKVK